MRVLKDSYRGAIGVPTQTGPHRVEMKPHPALIAVTVDVEELVKRLGLKALKSKGKRATAFHGALVVQVAPIDEETNSLFEAKRKEKGNEG